MILSKKVCSFVAIGLLGVLVPGSASATLVALTDNTGSVLNKAPSGTGTGQLHPDFDSVGAGDIVASATDDAHIGLPGASTFLRNANNNNTLVGSNGSSISLFKFDLSAIPAGATINKAQLQLWGRSGNEGGTALTGTSFGPISSFNWSEGSVTANSPIGTADTPEWGTGSSVFDIDAGVDVLSTTKVDGRTGFQTYSNPASGEIGHISSKAVGQNVFTYFMVEDVTGSLQAMVDGTADNYGWAGDLGNYALSSSENTLENAFGGVGAANYGGGTKPTLFVDFTPVAVPEPSSFLMLSALALGFGFSRKRKS